MKKLVFWPLKLSKYYQSSFVVPGKRSFREIIENAGAGARGHRPSPANKENRFFVYSGIYVRFFRVRTPNAVGERDALNNGNENFVPQESLLGRV